MRVRVLQNSSFLDLMRINTFISGIDFQKFITSSIFGQPCDVIYHIYIYSSTGQNQIFLRQRLSNLNTRKLYCFVNYSTVYWKKFVVFVTTEVICKIELRLTVALAIQKLCFCCVLKSDLRNMWNSCRITLNAKFHLVLT